MQDISFTEIIQIQVVWVGMQSLHDCMPTITASQMSTQTNKELKSGAIGTTDVCRDQDPSYGTCSELKTL